MVYYNGAYQGSIRDALQNLYNVIIAYVPNLIVAIIVLLLGWLLAEFLGRVVFKILEIIKVDKLADRLGLDQLSQRAGRQMSVSKFGRWLIKWFFLVGSFLAAADILGLTQVSAFLYNRVLPYFGNVVIASAILLIGTYAANFLADLIKGALSAGGIKTSGGLVAITRWAIMIFAILAALSQLGVASSFLQNLFMGIVAMLAIAGGLAFGLGGKDHAKKILDKIEHDLM